MIAMQVRASGRLHGRWLSVLLLNSACNPPRGDTVTESTTDADNNSPSDPTSNTDPLPTTSNDPSTTTPTTSAGSQSGSGGGSESGSTSADPHDQPVCGDGEVDTSEECEPQTPTNNDCNCYAYTCRRPKCGNGKPELCEQCDLGRHNGITQYDGCDSECKLMSHCGDKIVDISHESCDEGESGGIDDNANIPCTGICTWKGRAVFVTRAMFTGDLGGIPGADLKCRAAAENAGLDQPDSFRAWLSDSQSSPLDTFKLKDLQDTPYYRLGNFKGLAKDFSALVSEGLVFAIEYDEHGQIIADNQPFVWTNTGTDGKPANLVTHCKDWTFAGQSSMGLVGLLDHSDDNWTKGLKTFLDCNIPARLYCFQDAPDAP